MIIVGPGVAKGKVCTKPVELLDIYPTLLGISKLKPDLKLQGNSLEPLLKNPAAEWPYLARTSFGPKNVAIRSERYRYIRYNDGTEEFYDQSTDPHEWNNLINQPKFANQIKQHRDALPTNYHPLLGAKSTGHKTFEASHIINHKK